MKKLIEKIKDRNAKIRNYKRKGQKRCVLRYGESVWDIEKDSTNSIVLAYLKLVYLKLISKKKKYKIAILDRYY